MPSRLSTEVFIERSIRKHGDKYDYSLVVYKNRQTPVEIVCPLHGAFFQRPEVHLSGSGCQECAKNKPLTTASFIEKAKKVHGDIYNYEFVEYNGSQIPVEIVCKRHGVFRQAPAMHLAGQGCILCSGKKKKTTDEFIREASEVHKGFYDYSFAHYVSRRTPVTILCPVHGEFLQQPASHLKGNGCPKCAGNSKKNVSTFISEASLVHNSFYSYEKAVYTNSHGGLTITCPIHGDFSQKVGDHLNGAGCPACGLGWRRERFKNLVHKTGKGILYVVKMYNDEEVFYKIGITTSSINKRLKCVPYKWVVEQENVVNNGSLLFDLEKHIHNRYKDYRYIPLIKFDGHTECFTGLDMACVLKSIETFKYSYNK